MNLSYIFARNYVYIPLHFGHIVEYHSIAVIIQRFLNHLRVDFFRIRKDIEVSHSVNISLNHLRHFSLLVQRN